MKTISRNLSIKRILTLIIISILNFLFLAGTLYLLFQIYPVVINRYIFISFLIICIFSTLPLLIFILSRIDSAIGPMTFNDLYVKTINSILSTDSFEDILNNIFDSVVIIIKAGYGRIICYHTESDVFDIQYENDRSHELFHRKRTDADDRLISCISGPHDIITRSKTAITNDRKRIVNKMMKDLNADIAVPIFFNKVVLGVIAVGEKKKFSEREIRLLKIIAHKLAILSVNSYYFTQIKKRKEVEKEYILTNRIQKQFLPDPSLESGRIVIKAHHETESSLTREFYDIFINNKEINDIRLSAYRVFGDVKETSIFMPGIQAILQSYSRLGYSPLDSIKKLKKLISEKNMLNGKLMIFHSSINQSGKFNWCSSDYPAPFFFQKSTGTLNTIHNENQDLQYSEILMNPGDLIFIICNYYHFIINTNITEYSELINSIHTLHINEIKNILVRRIKQNRQTVQSEDSRHNYETEDKLIIIIGRKEDNQ
ncbi:MAG: GAF domain-containing protein [Spirochaetes bacterium]|nr:GAF domain-containing protein [Spirochaetota bacterium]